MPVPVFGPEQFCATGDELFETSLPFFFPLDFSTSGASPSSLSKSSRSRVSSTFSPEVCTSPFGSPRRLRVGSVRISRALGLVAVAAAAKADIFAPRASPKDFAKRLDKLPFRLARSKVALACFRKASKFCSFGGCCGGCGAGGSGTIEFACNQTSDLLTSAAVATFFFL
jgi:hypothetical protein